MKILRHSFAASFIAAALFALSTREAHACACCSDPGDYWLKTAKMTEYEFAQIEGMEFGANAELYMTDAGEDAVKGISSIAESYGVKVKIDKKQWMLKFRTEEGKTGTLTLVAPTKLTDFDVDIHDGQKSGGGGPLLYKEWRVEGAVSGDGIFGKAKARYSLVFQGRGNRCDNGNDFSHWRLEVTGKNIAYIFHGELVQEKTEPAEPEPVPAAEPEAKKPATEPEKKQATEPEAQKPAN